MPPRRKAKGLRPYATGAIQNSRSYATGIPLQKRPKHTSLPLNAPRPVLKDEVVVLRKIIVKSIHRLPQVFSIVVALKGRDFSPAV